MLADYVFTFIGINILGCITEANVLMREMMNLDFTIGFIVRLIQCSLVIFLYFALKNPRYKKYEIYVKYLLIIEIIINLVHLGWIFIFYLKYM